MAHPCMHHTIPPKVWYVPSASTQGCSPLLTIWMPTGSKAIPTATGTMLSMDVRLFSCAKLASTAKGARLGANVRIFESTMVASTNKGARLGAKHAGLFIAAMAGPTGTDTRTALVELFPPFGTSSNGPRPAVKGAMIS